MQRDTFYKLNHLSDKFTLAINSTGKQVTLKSYPELTSIPSLHLEPPLLKKKTHIHTNDLTCPQKHTRDTSSLCFLDSGDAGSCSSNVLPPPTCFLRHRSHFSPAGLQLQLLEEGLIVLRAVGVAGAGPNDHDRLLDGLPWGALKLHLDGFGVVGGAAPAIAADPAEPGFVGMQARTILELQVDGFQGLLGAETLFTFLVC